MAATVAAQHGASPGRVGRGSVSTGTTAEEGASSWVLMSLDGAGGARPGNPGRVVAWAERVGTVGRVSSWERAAAVAGHLDAVSPARLAQAALARLSRRRRSRAAGDPRWAGIEARRRNERGTIIFLSEDLNLADHGTQRRIAAALTPDPAWVPLARRVSGWSAGRALGWARTGAQRAGRGWADSDAWDMGHHLAAVSAAMLEHLADIAHGWPDGEELPTPEDWDAALRSNAAALRAYVADPAVDQALHTWHDLATAEGGDGAEAEVAFEELAALEAARDAAGAAAMHWVAEHLGQLWD